MERKVQADRLSARLFCGLLQLGLIRGRASFRKLGFPKERPIPLPHSDPIIPRIAMNRVAPILSCWALAALALAFTGCAGYQMGDVKPTAYQSISRLHVPTFENKTLEPRVSTIVTNAVIKGLQQDGTYEIVSKENADAVLVGEIERIERRQLRASQTDTLKTTEMQLFIVVEWSLVDPKTGTKLEYAEAKDPSGTRAETSTLRYRPGRVVGRTIQFLDPNFQLSERNALPIAAEDLAKQLVGQLTTGW